jgi:trans-aconitate 2-methyltransferase
MTDRDRYTFGDTDEAGARLKLLAELYESDARALLERSALQTPDLAVDLGCGPGWSTSLIHHVLNPKRTVGLDASARYIDDAKRLQSPALHFEVHDVARAPFPTCAPDLMFCRFLLTHLSKPAEVLSTWARVCGPNGLLLIHETETLDTDNPTLSRYYELVGQLQQHYGQTHLMGALLENCLKESGWLVVS